jgi:hypothetical protein
LTHTATPAACAHLYSVHGVAYAPDTTSVKSTPLLRIVRKTVRISVVGGRLVVIIDSDMLHPYTQPNPIKAFRPLIEYRHAEPSPNHSGAREPARNQTNPRGNHLRHHHAPDRDPHPPQTRMPVARAKQVPLIWCPASS